MASARSPLRMVASSETGELVGAFQFRSPTLAVNRACMVLRFNAPLETATPELEAAASRAKESKWRPSTRKRFAVR